VSHEVKKKGDIKPFKKGENRERESKSCGLLFRAITSLRKGGRKGAKEDKTMIRLSGKCCLFKKTTQKK